MSSKCKLQGGVTNIVFPEHSLRFSFQLFAAGFASKMKCDK